MTESRCRHTGCCSIMNVRIQAGISLPVDRREALGVASFLQLFRRLKLNTHNHNCDTCKIVTIIRVLQMTVFNTSVTTVHTAEYCDVFVKSVAIHRAAELKTSVKCSTTVSNKIKGNWTFPVLTLPSCCMRGAGYRLLVLCAYVLRCVMGGAEYIFSKHSPCLRHARNWWGCERNVPSPVVCSPVGIKT